MGISFDFCLKSIGAGSLIGIAGIANLEIGGLAGAFAFGLGLYLVILNGLWLYTGKIGYQKEINFKKIIVSLPLNLIGAAILGYVYYNSYQCLDCQELVYKKLELFDNVVLLRAVLCGAMMVCAVESFKRTNHWIGVFLSVFVFVACGFEHCIADTFYVCACNYITFDSIWFVFQVFLGNTLGSLLMYELIVKKNFLNFKN